MKCPRCGEEYPSATYFVVPGLCRECFQSLPPEEKSAVADGLPDRDALERERPDDVTRRELPGRASLGTRFFGVAMVAVGILLEILRGRDDLGNLKIVTLANACMLIGAGVGLTITGRRKLQGMTAVIILVAVLVALGVGAGIYVLSPVRREPTIVVVPPANLGSPSEPDNDEGDQSPGAPEAPKPRYEESVQPD